MNLHSLRHRPGARRRARRVGRGPGSGSGKTCGRGHKGQGARAGSGHRPGFEGGQMPLIRRLPKRGFKSPGTRIVRPVNLGTLARFGAGATVTPDTLRKAGLAKGRWDEIKILGRGEPAPEMKISAHAFSVEARRKIEASGGACSVLS